MNLEILRKIKQIVDEKIKKEEENIKINIGDYIEVYNAHNSYKGFVLDKNIEDRLIILTYDKDIGYHIIMSDTTENTIKIITHREDIKNYWNYFKNKLGE